MQKKKENAPAMPSNEMHNSSSAFVLATTATNDGFLDNQFKTHKRSGGNNGRNEYFEFEKK